MYVCMIACVYNDPRLHCCGNIFLLLLLFLFPPIICFAAFDTFSVYLLDTVINYKRYERASVVSLAKA